MESATAAMVMPRRSREARSLGPNSKFDVMDILTTVREKAARLTRPVSLRTSLDFVGCDELFDERLEEGSHRIPTTIAFRNDDFTQVRALFAPDVSECRSAIEIQFLLEGVCRKSVTDVRERDGISSEQTD